MNLGEAKTSLAILINKYSTRGTITSSTDSNAVDDYNKMYLFLDIAQKNIAETKHIKKYFKASQYLPFTPVESQFDNFQHTDSDITYSSAEALAYHFSVDDTADVYIEGIDAEGDATILDSIYAYSNEGFNSFKDIITIPDDASYESVQIRFSGDYFYNVKNTALFNVQYSHYSKIPDFARYIEYEMPSDFTKALSVEIRKGRDYRKLTNFEWENPTTLAVSSYESGELRIEYVAKPDTIKSNTAATYDFEIADSLQDAMLYYAASLLLQHENASVSSRMLQLYEEKMYNYSNNRELPQTKVKRVR